jgi:hypothetical protein
VRRARGLPEQRPDGEPKRVTRRSKRGGGAGASVVAAGVRVRVQRGLGLLFVGRRGHIGVRARGEKLAGDLGEELRAGEERGRRKEGTDSLGPAARERKKGAVRFRRGREAPTGGARLAERERKRGVRALGLGNWAGAAHAGEKRERSAGPWGRLGPGEKRGGEERGELGRAKGFGAAFFPSSFPFLHSNHSNNSI